MHTNPQHDIRAISQQFEFVGPMVAAEPYGSGHINDTYRVTCDGGQYILQRINHAVFKNPVAVMENIYRVTTHLHAKLRNGTDRALTLVPARDGRIYSCDAAGNHWRAYLFIDRAHTYDAVEKPQQAFQAARAFGRFQQQLADLPAPRLQDTIPDFHHTPKRFAALEAAIAGDVANRAKLAKPEIEFALRRQAMTPVLLEAGLPERITHNDTKFNNVMLNDATGEGMCVIDLDTVMPGLVLYDFGDMVRTTTSPVKEDERDLSKVKMQLPLFEALVRGYLSTAGEFLTPAERRYLAFSGKLITFEIGIRFLTDFLNGDTYFKTHRENHNLDRARTQFRLVESIEQQTDAMERLVASA